MQKVFIRAKQSEFEGMYYDKANKVITEKLEASGHLLKLDFFKHSYPHDWRTKNLLSSVRRHNGLHRLIKYAKIF